MMLVHGEPPYVSAGGFDFGKEHNKRLALLSPAALDFNVNFEEVPDRFNKGYRVKPNTL